MGTWGSDGVDVRKLLTYLPVGEVPNLTVLVPIV